MTMKRRDLLLGGAGMAAGAAAVALPEAKAQTASPSIRWDREADVVVIGSGASGLPAAIVAREAGLRLR